MIELGFLDEWRDITLESILLRILLATLLAGVLGAERGMKNRPAGMRTYILVSLGACLVSLCNQYTMRYFHTGDPVRLSAQVINGIGFLGAGTIILTNRDKIKGLTTAAGLWVSACMGITIGIGFYEGALLTTVVAFLVLSLMNNWDHRLRGHGKSTEVYIELQRDATFRDFLEHTQAEHLKIDGVQRGADRHSPVSTLAFIVTLHATDYNEAEPITNRLLRFSGLDFYQEL